MKTKCVSAPTVRHSTSTPRFPGVARHSLTPVRRRYWAYASPFAAGTAPCQYRAISGRLDPLELADGPFIADVPRVERGLGFEQQHVRLLRRDRQMLHAPRHDREFPFVQPDVTIAEPELQPPFHDQEELVLRFVMVPHKLTLQLDQLHKV